MNRKGVLFLVVSIFLLTVVYALNFNDLTQSDFNNGAYVNTTHNGTAVVLSGNNLTGTFTSRIFDATGIVRWDNISSEKNLNSAENYYVIDITADFWKSNNSGVNWTKINDDYNGADGNTADSLKKNSSGSFFIMNNQDVWVSNNYGVSWTKINDDYNGAEVYGSAVFSVDKNDALVIIDTNERVWKSTNSGVSFTKINSTGFSGGTSNAYGIAINSSNAYFVVDGLSDVYRSMDAGVSWIKVNDDYNGAAANGASNGMDSNSSGSVFIIDGQDVWVSNNYGVSWTKINDDFNGASYSSNSQLVYADSSDNLYIPDALENIFFSNDSGVNFTLIATNMNGAGSNVVGMTSLIFTTNLTFQVKNCSSSDCSDGIWQTVNLSNMNLTGRYFQYMINFSTQEAGLTPELFNASIGYAILDNTPPQFSNYVENPGNNSAYVQGQTYNFNITITDNTAVGSVWAEFNGVNYTNGNITSNSNVYMFNRSNLASGTYSYKWWANDSFGNLNSSEIRYYAISKASSQVSLTFDKTSPQTYGASLVPSCSIVLGQGSAILTLNGSQIISGQALNLGAGNWDFNCSLAETGNYSSSSNFSQFIINKADPFSNMNILGTTPIVYGSVSDFSGVETSNGDSDCVYSINMGNQVYAAGTLTFNYSTSGCSNYTAGSVTKQLVINKATPSMSISGTASIDYGTAADINATKINNGDNDLTYSLYRNGVFLSNSFDLSILAAGAYTYMYTTSGGQNYTSRGVIFDLNVAKKISIASLAFDKTSPQTFGTSINASCSSNNPEGNLELYRNNINVTSENNQNVFLSAGVYNYLCNVSESQNYSSAGSAEVFTIDKFAGEVKLYLNGLENNLTLFSIKQLNITSTTLYGNLTIYLNGSDITLENGINTTKSAGYYNVTAVSSGDENHSSETITRWLNIIEDTTVPSMSIISPTDGNIYGYDQNISLDFAVSDENLQSCWYNLDNGANITIVNCQNTTFDVSGSGNYTLALYSNDSYGNKNGLNVNFSVQLDAPTITLSSPKGVYLNSNNVAFKYTPGDVDLGACELWGNFNGLFELNQTDFNPINYSENTFNLSLADGAYTWNVKCNDTNGHSAFDGNKVFHVDTTAPLVHVINPAGVKNSRAVSVSWAVTDASPTTCKYNVYRGLNVEIGNTSVDCSINSTSFNVTLDADFVLNLYVNDSAGNSNYTNSSFSVSTTQQQNNGGGGSSGGGGGSSGGGLIIPKKASLETESISNLVVSEAGVKKVVSWKVKNNGTGFLNECKFKSQGEFASWIPKTEIKGLAAGEEYTFVFDVNIPENAQEGKYSLGVSLTCMEVSASSNFFVDIKGKQVDFKLTNVNRTSKESVNVGYSLQDLSGKDQNIELQFLLFDADNKKVSEINESRFVAANSKKEFETTIPIRADLQGELSLLVNLNSETYSSFVQENIVLGSPVSGFAIFGNAGSRDTIISLVIVLLFLVFAFFIVRRIRTHHKVIKVRHYWQNHAHS